MQLNEKTKNILSLILRFGLSGLLLSFLYTKIDIEKTVEIVKTAELSYIFYGFVIFAILHCFLIYRWRLYIRALNIEASILKIIRFFAIGLFGNLFLPSAIGGDVIKTVGLCTNSSQKPAVVASVLLDRLSGFAGMVIVSTIAFTFGFKYINDMSLSVSILGMAIASSTITFVLFNEKVYSFFCRVFSPFPKVKNGIMNMHYDAVLLKDKKSVMVKAVLLGAFGQICLAVVFFLIAKGLHQDISLMYFLIFVPLICLASCFPSIGGLGVREAGAAFLFSKIGVASGIAVSISLVNFLFMVVMGIVGWLFFMITKNRRQETAG